MLHLDILMDRFFNETLGMKNGIIGFHLGPIQWDYTGDIFNLILAINLPYFIFVFLPLFWGIIYNFFDLKNVDWNKAAFTGLFYESENEPSSANDYKLLCDQMVILCTFVVSGVLFLYRYPQYASSPMVWNIVLWSIYILILPTFIMVIFGAYFLNYLKGEGNSNNGAVNSVFDFSNLFGFLKRFAIQMIRYFLITIKIGLFLMFMEGDFVLNRRLDMLDEVHAKVPAYPIFMVNMVFFLFREALHVLVELANAFVVYYSQLGAFVIILFWLLSALFSNSWGIVSLLWLRVKQEAADQEAAEREERLEPLRKAMEEFYASEQKNN